MKVDVGAADWAQLSLYMSFSLLRTYAIASHDWDDIMVIS